MVSIQAPSRSVHRGIRTASNGPTQCSSRQPISFCKEIERCDNGNLKNVKFNLEPELA